MAVTLPDRLALRPAPALARMLHEVADPHASAEGRPLHERLGVVPTHEMRLGAPGRG